MSKLTYEDKINIYINKKNGMSTIQLSNKYKVGKTTIKYIYRLIEVHGYNVLGTTKNKYYSPSQKEKIINRLLIILIQVSGLAKSVYYYTLSKIDKDDKNKEIIDKIKEIFINNKERYGYRRITLELRNQGYNVNHKKVYRIMVKLGLKPLKRNKRKYSSYKGTVGKIADNLIERNFSADNPNEKWYTDVTEFNLRGEKCYLSPILDGYNGEVISYNTSKSPNLEQINDMLNKAFDKNNKLDGLIFHSDQGWQYQHESYQQRLKNKGIKQSMSRKGNSMDNGMMENFFGLLKTEMFYDQEDEYKTLDELIKAIDDYIYYYNYDRIKVKLKGLSPVNYRLQSSN